MQTDNTNSENFLKTVEIIDSHCHIFPDKIAVKAAESIGKFYGISMYFPGTVEGLLAEGRQAGISRFVVCSSATSVEQAEPINRFILSQMKLHPEFIGYITLHPAMSETAIAREIEFAVENGFKGIKLHPDFQRFYLDGDDAKKIYRAASGVLPILFHTGDRRFDFSKPARLAEVAMEFPDLICIGAHFGGYSRWDEISCYKGLGNVYVDTSSSLQFLGPEEATRFIDFFGAEWFFFGTDYPMWNAAEELRRFMRLELDETRRRMILSENYKRVMGV